MGFWNIFTRRPWSLASAQPPWGSSPSIHRHILEHGADRLPDEKDDGNVKWVAGGLDGAFGHHSSSAGRDADHAARVHKLIVAVLADATDARIKELYEALLTPAMDYVDALLDALTGDEGIDRVRLHELAEWLAGNAHHREPVKVALAILGLSTDERDAELIRTLARHEEFTLYGTLALSKLRAGERHLFDLAREVDGWGRIQIVERLARTRDDEIKRWMLREGYKNSVLYEYLAYTCATAGDLRKALAEESVDDALLAGAGDILQALINGGPAEDMRDYADGAAVAELYLKHLGEAPTNLEHLITVDALLRFLDGSAWTPDVRARLRERCVAIEKLPHWPELVRAALASTDRVTFARGDQAARALAIDTWPQHFARLESGIDDGWYYVMQTTDPERIDRVIALALERIPLESIATGPAEEVGLGPEWKHHGALDFILQDLRAFPGKGWPLIRAALRSPVVRNRNMAVRAFSEWDQARWPEDARALLERAVNEEPDTDVRSKLEALLRGERISKPDADSN